MAALTDFLFIGLLLRQCQGKLAHASQIQSTTIIKKKKIPKGKLSIEENLLCKPCQIINNILLRYVNRCCRNEKPTSDRHSVRVRRKPFILSETNKTVSSSVP